jgi:hypothetical protein
MINRVLVTREETATNATMTDLVGCNLLRLHLRAAMTMTGPRRHSFAALCLAKLSPVCPWPLTIRPSSNSWIDSAPGSIRKTANTSKLQC